MTPVTTAASPKTPPADRPARPARPFQQLQSKALQERIKAVEDDARALCELAIAEARAKNLEHFVVLIEQGRFVTKDARGEPVYTTIQTPYMNVDGRIVMAQDEHRLVGKTYRLRTRFYKDDAGTTLCKATFVSPLRGVAEGHVKVVESNRGVNSTNPYENAETSAIGRALGNAGYGIFGTGIASAEEVLTSLRKRNGEAPASSAVAKPAPAAPETPTINDRQAPAPAASAPTNPTPPASSETPNSSPVEADIDALGNELDLRPGEIDLLRAQLGDPNAVLERLREMKNDRSSAQKPPAEGSDNGHTSPGNPSGEPGKHAGHETSSGKKPSIFKELNSLFNALKIPGAERVSLMKQHSGKEEELVAELKKRPNGNPEQSEGPLEADKVPF